MNKKLISALLAVICVFSLLLAGCGDKEPEAAATDAGASYQPTGVNPHLSSWELESATWSSPNGATVTIRAVPTADPESQSAAFVVRLEGDEVANVPCTVEDGAYVASADLNAADGLCYFLVLTQADGTTQEVAVNTPTATVDDTLVNMETALNCYANGTVETFDFAEGSLTITAGSAEIQLPRITNLGQKVTCAQAYLTLSMGGQELAKTDLSLPEADENAKILVDLSGEKFSLPALEDDYQLLLQIHLTLSNGQELSAPCCTLFYNAGQLLPAVG